MKDLKKKIIFFWFSLSLSFFRKQRGKKAVYSAVQAQCLGKRVLGEGVLGGGDDVECCTTAEINYHETLDKGCQDNAPCANLTPPSCV